jgi:uncharacterized damage-inducible protein DinB
MNADAFRHFYEYHFTENRKMWDTYIMSLSQEQFTQPVDYSLGSVRNQIVHLMNVDNSWFGDLSGITDREELAPTDLDDREKIRAYGDKVEHMMRAYLAQLSDDMLTQKPFPDGEDKDLILWQVLLHVGNHGTDHRAQMLRLLNDLGLKTTAQDYVFYIYENPSLGG